MAELSAEQHARFLALLTEDKALGNVTALKLAGVEGTRGELKALMTDDLLAEAREARGWRIRGVEATTWTVATNPEHPSWDRANARLLKAYGGPQFRDHTQLELSGPDGAPIQTEDRSASLGDVLTQLRAIGATEDSG